MDCVKLPDNESNSIGEEETADVPTSARSAFADQRNCKQDFNEIKNVVAEGSDTSADNNQNDNLPVNSIDASCGAESAGSNGPQNVAEGSAVDSIGVSNGLKSGCPQIAGKQSAVDLIKTNYSEKLGIPQNAEGRSSVDSIDTSCSLNLGDGIAVVSDLTQNSKENVNVDDSVQNPDTSLLVQPNGIDDSDVEKVTSRDKDGCEKPIDLISKEDAKVEEEPGSEVIETEVIENEIFSYVDEPSTIFLGGESTEPVKFCQFVAVKTEDDSNSSTTGPLQSAVGEEGAVKDRECSNEVGESESSCVSDGEKNPLQSDVDGHSSNDNSISNKVVKENSSCKSISSSGINEDSIVKKTEGTTSSNMKQCYVRLQLGIKETSELIKKETNSGTESNEHLIEAAETNLDLGTTDTDVEEEEECCSTATGSRLDTHCKVSELVKKDCYVLLERCNYIGGKLLEETASLKKESVDDALNFQIVDVKTLCGKNNLDKNRKLDSSLSNNFTKVNQYFVRCNICSRSFPIGANHHLTQHLQFHDSEIESVELSSLQSFFFRISSNLVKCYRCFRCINFKGRNEVLISHLHRKHRIRVEINRKKDNVSSRECIQDLKDVSKYYFKEDQDVSVCKICLTKIPNVDIRLISHLVAEHETRFPRDIISHQKFSDELHSNSIENTDELRSNKMENPGNSGKLIPINTDNGSSDKLRLTNKDIGISSKRNNKAQVLTSPTTHLQGKSPKKIVTRKPGRTWSNFTKLAERGLAECNICQASVSYTGGNFENLTKHLDDRHPPSDNDDGREPLGKSTDSSDSPSGGCPSNEIEAILIKEEVFSDNEESAEKPLQEPPDGSELKTDKNPSPFIKNSVWKYFFKMQSNTARCNRCHCILSYKGCDVARLIYHLRKSHSIIPNSRENEELDQAKDQPPSPSSREQRDRRSAAADEVNNEPNYYTEIVSNQLKISDLSRDDIWKWFRQINSRIAECKVCERRLIFKGRLHNLKRHLLVYGMHCMLKDNAESYNSHGDEVVNKLKRDLMSDDDDDGEESGNDRVPVSRPPDFTKEDDKVKEANEKNNCDIEKEIWLYYKKSANGNVVCKLCAVHVKVADITNLMHHIWETHAMKLVRLKRSLEAESAESSISSPTKRVKRTLNEDCEQENDDGVDSENRGRKNNAMEEVLSPKSNNVRMYFKMIGNSTAKCNLCSSGFVPFNGRNTSDLSLHLWVKHKIVLQDDEERNGNGIEIECSSKERKRMTILKCFARTKANAVKCKVCFEKFTKDRSSLKVDHLKEKHKDIYKVICKYLEKRTCVDKKLLRFFNRRITFKAKCNLCKKRIIYDVADKENLKKHLYKTHRREIAEAGKLMKNDRVVRSELTVDDDMNVIVKRKPDYTNDSPQRKLTASPYFVRLGSSGAKCNVCRKFISNKIHCSHNIPLAFSLSQGIRGNYLKKSRRCNYTTGTTTSWSYFSILNQLKDECKLCFPSLVNGENIIHKFMSHCTLGKSSFEESSMRNYSTLSEQFFNSNSDSFKNNRANLSVTPSCFLQQVKASHTLMFSLRCLNKFQCNLCSETVQRMVSPKPFAIPFKKDLRHLSLQHRVSSFYINKDRTGPDHKSQVNVKRLANAGEDSEEGGVEWTEDMSQMICSSSLDYKAIREIQLRIESRIPPPKRRKKPGNRHGIVQKKSEVWAYFNDVGGGRASCRLCHIAFSFRHGAISNLARHLRLKHSASLSERLKKCYKHRFETRPPNLNPRRKSETWNYFTKKENDWAQCNVCGKHLSYRGGTVHNLTRHLRSVHMESSPSVDILENETAGEPTRDDTPDSLKSEIDREEVENPHPEVCDDPRRTDETFYERDEKKKLKKKSQIWTYFTEDATGKGKCKICRRSFSFKSGSTSNLSRHLRTKHNIFIFTVPNCSIALKGLDSIESTEEECVGTDESVAIIEAQPDDLLNYAVDEDSTLSFVEDDAKAKENDESCKEQIIYIPSSSSSPPPSSSSTSLLTVPRVDCTVSGGINKASDNMLLKETVDTSNNASVVVIEKGITVESQEDKLDVSENSAVVGESEENIFYEVTEGGECSIVEARISESGEVQYILSDYSSANSTELVSETTEEDKEMAILKSLSERNVREENRDEEEENQDAPLAEQLMYLQQKRHKEKRSLTWRYCERIGADKAKCLICSVVLSYKSNTLHNLTRHLFKQHPGVLKDVPQKPKLTLNLNASDLISEDQNIRSLEVKDSCVIFVKEPEPENVKLQKRRSDSNYGKFKTSFIWNYFTPNNGMTAKCNLCCKLLSYKGGATNNLARHLRSRHGFIKSDENTTKLSII